MEHVADHHSPIPLQMLWWRIEEMLVDFFARHVDVMGYEREPNRRILGLMSMGLGLMRCRR